MTAVCSDSRDHVVTSTAQSRAGHREIPQTTNPVHVRARVRFCGLPKYLHHRTEEQAFATGPGGQWSGTVALWGFRVLTVMASWRAMLQPTSPLTTWAKTSGSLAAAREAIIG